MSDIPLEPLPEPLPETVAEIPPTYQSTRTGINREKPFMSSADIVAIIAVLSVCLVALCCISACALVSFAFFQNPPW